MSDSPQIIQRPRRTYGSRRDPPKDTPTYDNSFDAEGTIIDLHEDPDVSISSSGGYDIPPSSDASFVTGHAGDDSSDDEPTDAADRPRFQFDWRKKLVEIDEGVHDEDIQTSSRRHADSPTRSPSRTEPDKAVADASTSEQHSPNGSQPSSPPVRTKAPRRITLPPSDPEFDADRRPSTPQSPTSSLMGTPGPRTSQTPPTSTEALPHRGKDKGKALEPLRFTHAEKPALRSKAQTKKQDRAKRVKPPTKREELEMRKNTMRIIAEMPAAIQPAPQAGSFSLSALLQRIKPTGSLAPQPISRPGTPPNIPTSDPIQSSSPATMSMSQGYQASSPEAVAAREQVFEEPSFKPTGLLEEVDLDSDSDAEGLPDFSALNMKLQAQEAEAKRLADLHALKLRAAEQRKVIEDDSDSDLEILDDPKSVAHDAAQARHGMQMRREFPTTGSMKQLAAAGPNVRRDGVPIDALDTASVQHVLRAAAQPSFLTSSVGSKPVKRPNLSHKDLNKVLLLKAARQSEDITKQKEEEWKRRGGKIKEQPSLADGAKLTLEQILEKRRIQATHADVDAEMVHDDSDSDEDYRPEGDDGAENLVDSDAENHPGSSMRVEADPQADDEDDDENPFIEPRIRRRAVAAHSRIAVESDEEDDVIRRSPLKATRGRTPTHEPTAGETQGPDLTHRASVSSFSENTDGTRTEDGTDKENDARLSFDRGDDKENTVIAVQPSSQLLGRNLGSLFASSVAASPSGSTGRGAPDGVRSPLKELPAEDDDPFAFTPGPLLKLGRSGEDSDVLEASPMNLGEGSGLQPAFTLSAKGKGKERARSNSPSPLGDALDLGGGLGGGGGFSQFFTQAENARGFDQLKAAQDNDDISLTMDSGLQPALDVSSSFLRKADEIFEKEQEAIAVQEQANVQKEAVPEMFVDENGFLTQTRREFVSPMVHRATQFAASLRLSSPASISVTPLSSVRKPLGTLMTQDPDDDENDLPALRRLRKRSEDDTPASKLRSAFDVLGKRRSPKQKQKQVKSVFIEGEAEESDDEAGFGFGVRPKEADDEEEDGEDQDKMLPELVDDKEMDDETLAKEAVDELHREFEEQQDQALEKKARDAVTGKLRVRRRDHGGLSDSDSDDDEDARRIRNRGKKPRLENDTIKSLAKNDATRAFANEYRVQMDDDDAEFAHLKEDHDTMDVDDDQKSQSDEEHVVVSAMDLQRELRAAAIKGAKAAEFNPHDVSYADEDVEDEDEVTHRVREISNAVPAARRADGETDIESVSFNKVPVPARLAQWAKSETSSRTAGVTGRNSGASAAVTGHGKGKASAGSGSFKPSRTASSSSSSIKGAKLAKAPSILSSALSSRRGKFGN